MSDPDQTGDPSRRRRLLSVEDRVEEFIFGSELEHAAELLRAAADSPDIIGGPPPPPPPPSPATNERIKLTATFLNTIGAGMIALGVVGPMVGVQIGTLAATADRPWWHFAISGIIWFAIGLSLHAAARRSLGRLR